MDRSKKFVILVITIIIAIAICVALSVFLLDNKGKINQGAFRINDFIVSSKINYEEKQKVESEEYSLDNITYNISQINELQLLIAKETDVSKAYINNISLTGPTKAGNVVLKINNDENLYDIYTTKQIDLNLELKDDKQYYLNLNLENKNFVMDAKLPEDVSSIVFDGRLLEKFGVNQNEISMELKFDLNIEDLTGKVSVCKFRLSLPDEQLTRVGNSIVREDLNKFLFVLK